jgi:hypothetical protein
MLLVCSEIDRAQADATAVRGGAVGKWRPPNTCCGVFRIEFRSCDRMQLREPGVTSPIIIAGPPTGGHRGDPLEGLTKTTNNRIQDSHLPSESRTRHLRNTDQRRCFFTIRLMQRLPHPSHEDIRGSGV